MLTKKVNLPARRKLGRFLKGKTMQQLTEQQAIAIYESGEWENWDHEQIVRFQLFQDRLCMPFQRFHEAITKVLGRAVYTHEFAFKQKLIDEYFGISTSPTFQEIMELIPEEKRLLIIGA